MRLSDHAAERDYLACVSRDGSWLDQWSVPPEAFDDPRHVIIMSALIDLRERSEEISTLNLQRNMERLGVISKAGGHEYILSWMAPASSPPATRRRVLEMWDHRRMREKLELALSETNALRGIEAEAIVTELAAGFKRRDETKIERVYDSAERAFGIFARRDGMRGLVPTGLHMLDRIIGGLSGGNLMLIGADTGVGKTSVALTMMDVQDRRGHVTGLVSCEDGDDVIGSRAFSMRGHNVSALKMRRRVVDEALRHRAAIGVSEWSKSKAMVAYEIGSDDYAVAQAMTSLVRDHGCNVLYVDYVQTINAHVRADSRREEVRRVASRVKGTAKHLGVPVVLLSQIARPMDKSDAAKKKPHEPGKHSFKETGDLENMAELCMVLWRASEDPQHPEYGTVHAKIAKSKVGGDGLAFDFFRDTDTGVLRQAAREYEDTTPHPAEGAEAE